MNLLSRFRGSLLGLAVGDALGAPVEFEPRGSFPPITGYRGGGPFNLGAGDWTDDTSLTLCLAESLVERRGFDPRDQVERYVRWWREGHMSCTGNCFDIGNTTKWSLQRFIDTGDPYSGPTDPGKASNGSLMRLAPVPLFFHASPADAIEYSGLSSKTTHGAANASSLNQRSISSATSPFEIPSDSSSSSAIINAFFPNSVSSFSFTCKARFSVLKRLFLLPS